MLEEIARSFSAIAPAVDFWSIRLVDARRQYLSVRQGILQPVKNEHRLGALISVAHAGGTGYAATCDLTAAGLATAASRARDWAEGTGDLCLLLPEQVPHPQTAGVYRTPVVRAWDSASLEDKIAWLHAGSRNLKIDDAIVDWLATLDYQREEVLMLNGLGLHIQQSLSYLTPGLLAVANRNSETQQRSFGFDLGGQGGLELLQRFDLNEEAHRVADEALQLLDAPPCPAGRMDALLLPGQMILQIHESIGHPLELDRILGDERNFAGTSFVTLDMFGCYRYGSELLNVTFDPNRTQQLASYGFDDDGTQAQRQFLIRDGLLLRPLGGAVSQARSGLRGVASARANGWNRPPVDRMANLNLEPGTSSRAELLAAVEYGVLLDTNRSWSIDDSRNNFQFGCEWGRLIQGGELKGVVRDPNYRGISASFWRSLALVGDESTFAVLGVRSCGKGEPNQVMQVGHASPACVFRGVDVFSAA